MAKSLKEFMALSKDELISLGNQHGLSFHGGMGKGQMAKQLENSLASGWLEVNHDLMNGAIDTLHEDSAYHFGTSDMISDAAHVAQMIDSAGFSGSFHAAMNGPAHQAEAVHEYLDRLGVEADSVWMHLPKNNEYTPAQPFGMLNKYMRDTLTGHQDIMPEIAGHYAGDIMSEYATNLGGVEQSYDHLAHMYLDKSQYQNAADYSHDAARVSRRLQQAMGPMFHEVAHAAATGAKVSYMSILPQVGSPGIVGNSLYPREALNASGLPMGAMGSGINSEYSLTASLSGRPGWSDESRAIHSEVSNSLKSLAQVYRGESGLNARPHIVSDRDQILDSASRYADLTDVRSGYNNLVRDLGDDPRYSGNSIRAVLENAVSYNEADATPTFDPAEAARIRLAQNQPVGAPPAGNGFIADFGNPTNWNPAVARREAKAIADLDAASSNFHDTVNNGPSPSDGIRFHDLEQGSDEWLNFRKQYDITGSTVGAFLGNSQYDRPWAAMVDKVGLQRGKNTASEFTQRIFAKGHAAEEAGRARVAEMLGQEVRQVGAITNDQYPGFMYSPDGLIGDDALWEHKNPERAKDGFANLAAGDHPDYLDQIQMGMMLSGRKRTLFSQTRGGEMQHEWVDYDPTWYGRNKTRLDSVQERLAAGREWLEQNPGDDTDRERINGARAAMMGGGIWKDVRQRSNRGYSATAGTDADEFLQGSSRRDADFAPTPGTGVATIATGTSVATVANGTEVLGPGEASMAVAVKAGILAAQDENKNRRSGRVFEGEFSEVFPDDGISGGGGGRGGRGGSSMPGADEDDSNSGGRGGRGRGGSGGGAGPLDAFASGVAGGSVASMNAGALRALSMSGPWGRAAAVGIGAVQIGNEIAEGMNDFYGEALDAGFDGSSVNAYSAQRQGMEMLGLNSQQAGRIAQTTHSAYNTLLNGDPSAAVNMIRGSRGLLTMSDIREAQGDPVALARVMQDRAASRGWSQERVAGAMQMAGLHGMARANDRTSYDFQQAEGVVQAGRDADTSESSAQLRTLQGERARVLPGYNIPQAAMAHGGLFFEGAGDALRNTRYGVNAVSNAASSVYDFIAGEESGGNPNARSGSSSAYGAMQALEGTRRKPGFGVVPARDNSPEEAARVGRDYYDAMVREFNGDSRKAQAAYTDGHATVKRAVKEYGDDWLNHMPKQAQTRVERYDNWISGQKGLQAGAGGFTRGDTSYGQTNVNVNLVATVNNKTATATVSTPQGTSKTQELNMRAGAQRPQ